jgi:hypothetical protein
MAGLFNDGDLQSTYCLEIQRSQITTPSKWVQDGETRLLRYELEMQTALALYRRDSAAILRNIVGNPFSVAKN